MPFVTCQGQEEVCFPHGVGAGGAGVDALPAAERRGREAVNALPGPNVLMTAARYCLRRSNRGRSKSSRVLRARRRALSAVSTARYAVCKAVNSVLTVASVVPSPSVSGGVKPAIGPPPLICAHKSVPCRNAAIVRVSLPDWGGCVGRAA